MNEPARDELKNKLYEFNDLFSNLSLLIKKDKFPKCLLLSGDKGQGKYTLIHHVLACYFDENNYDKNSLTIKKDNLINKIKNNNTDNILYLSGMDNIKIDQIRDLRNDLQKSTINNKPRFIIFDDIELFSLNCSNALLKSVEEPNNFNYFILINNKRLPIIDTIKSRSIEIKIFLNDDTNKKIIEGMMKDHQDKIFFDYKNYPCTAGNFFIFNQICEDYNINLEDEIIKNIFKLLNLFKQKKDQKLFDFSVFLLSNHYFNLMRFDNLDINILEKKSLVLKKINDFRKLNLNINNLFLDIKRYI